MVTWCNVFVPPLTQWSCWCVVDVLSRVGNVCCTCLHCLCSLHYVWMDECLGLLEFCANQCKSARYARRKYIWELLFALIEGAQRCGPQPFALSGHKHLRTSHHQWIITAVDGRRTCDFDVLICSVPESFSDVFELSPLRECFQMLTSHPRNTLEQNSGEKTSLILWHDLQMQNEALLFFIIFHALYIRSYVVIFLMMRCCLIAYTWFP